MKRIIIGNAPVKSGNRGCKALTISSVYLITKILDSNEVDYKLFLLDKRASRGINNINILGRTISCENIVYPIPFRFKDFIKGLIELKNTIRSINVFYKADIIFDIGEGDSFSDIYSAFRFHETDRIHRTARFFSKPYVLLPQTIGPFTYRNVIKKGILSLKKASLVMTRDRQSYEYVKELTNGSNNVREFIDVAFFLPYTRKKFPKETIHVGLNISALMWHGGYKSNDLFGLKCDYKIIVREVLDFFISQPNIVVHLISHVLEQERSVENDYAISNDLFEEYQSNRIILAPFFMSPVDAKSYIAGMDFFMGARMHATIAAFSSGVPVVPMAYSRKFNGLFINTLNYKYMVDLKQDSTDDALRIIKSAFEQRNQLKEIIKSRLDGVVEEKKLHLFQDLTKLLQL